jgi:photosystem II stability/assembly factor-like uncharacterized protein
MKKLIYTFLTLLFVSSVSAQWVSQVNPLGSGQNAMTSKIQFVSSTEGWISLGNGKLLHTVNGGTNWFIVNPEPVDTLFSWSDPALNMSFINPSTGWIIRSKGTQSNMKGAVVYKTVNSGVNWTKVTIPVADAGMYIQFVDANNGWILIYNTNNTGGGYFRTTNGGTNWTQMIIPVGGFTFFTNSTNGWLYPINNTGTTSDSIRKTTNGGLNWTAPWGTNAQVTFTSLYFSDINNGWAVGTNGLLLKTTNGGNSWTYITNAGTTSDYRNNTLFFLNANTGWIGTKNNITGISYVVYTNNGGASWTVQAPPISTPPESNRIFSIHFFDALNGGLTADLGKICHTTNGGVRVTNISTEIPSSFSLSQNYPNPFNPSTMIKFDIPKSSFVKIKVFDITGKEIETLVNEQLQPGTYETDWNASSFSSGVYFYKITAESYTETKRMLIVK